MTDAVAIALITGTVSLGGTALSGYVASRVARLQIQANLNAQHIADTHVAMKELAVNTNGIKDALVKVTGEKAFDEGLKIGRETTRGETGPAGPQGDQGPKGEKGGIFS